MKPGVSDVVAATKKPIVVILSALILVGCGQESNKTQERMSEVERLYSEEYYFKPDGDIYLSVILKIQKDTNEVEGDARGIYRHLIYNDLTSTKHDVPYIYLNIYDENGHFLFQLSYDYRKGEFLKGQRPHY